MEVPPGPPLWWTLTVPPENPPPVPPGNPPPVPGNPPPVPGNPPPVPGNPPPGNPPPVPGNPPPVPGNPPPVPPRNPPPGSRPRPGPGPRPGGPPLLAVSGVSRRYGDRIALQPLDLTLAAGQCVAVLGANGSGKSTLLRIAAGRDTASTGRISYGGRAMSEDDPVVRTEIAVVGDLVSAYPDLTVREHLLLVAVAHGAGRGAGALVDRALGECRLADHAAALPGSLSSGQLQALQLATVLVRPRRLLVLDEPEQRLDPAARRWLGGLLRGEKDAGAALLIATHHTELAAAVADHVIVLSDGAVTAEGLAFRGSFSPALFAGVDTPVGNTAALSILFWYAWGTVLAVLPMTVLVSSVLRSPGLAPLIRALVIGAGLAAGLGAYAARRAGRLRAG